MPAEWPLPAVTGSQISEVRACDVEALSEERYPEDLPVADLEPHYLPANSCDWAVLTVAYVKRGSDEKLSEEAITAFTRTVLQNPGFIFSLPVFYAFVDRVEVVRQPEFLQQDLTAVKIDYTWGGYGAPAAYKLEIHQADTIPVITVTDLVSPKKNQKVKTEIDKALLQELGAALTDMVPIAAPFTITPCTDSQPDWVVTLTYRDGATVTLRTNRSNMLGMGGPWQMVVDGRAYMQYSARFPTALGKTISALNLPFGQPKGSFCEQADLLGAAFR